MKKEGDGGRSKEGQFRRNKRRLVKEWLIGRRDSTRKGNGAFTGEDDGEEGVAGQV